MILERGVIIYLAVMNLAGLFICGWDKRCAQKKQSRVPEKALFLVSLCGGAGGFYLGMQIFHHKTLHLRFEIGIPMILIAWVLLIFFFKWKMAGIF